MKKYIFLKPSFAKNFYFAEIYIYIEMNILKIQTPKKGHYYFKKDEPIRFLAETRMFPKWERC